MRGVLVILACCALSACTYQSSASVSPSYDVYSNYADKLPGHYALYVDAEEMSGKFNAQGRICSAHAYTQDARAAFKQSAVKTFQNLVENVEQVDQPLTQSDLLARNLDGQILIEVEEMNVRIKAIPGFWSGEMEADVELAAGLIVDGQEGRLLGTTVDADEDATTDAGSYCSGGADALSLATSEAIEELLQRLGERLTNSTRLREASAPTS